MPIRQVPPAAPMPPGPMPPGYMPPYVPPGSHQDAPHIFNGHSAEPPLAPFEGPDEVRPTPGYPSAAPMPPPIPGGPGSPVVMPGLAALLAATNVVNGTNGGHLEPPIEASAAPAVDMTVHPPIEVVAEPAAANAQAYTPAGVPPTEPSRPSRRTPSTSPPDLSNLPPAIAQSLSRLARSTQTGGEGSGGS